jgi:hypothetical protein
MSQIGYVMKSIGSIRVLQNKYPSRAKEIDEIVDYWKNESTFVKLLRESPEDIHHYQFPRGESYDNEGYYRHNDWVPGAGFLSGSYDSRIAGLMPDYQKLLSLGIPGLRDEINSYIKKNPRGVDFYNSLLICVNIMEKTLEHFRIQAETLSANTVDDDKRKNLTRCASALLKFQRSRPETLYEAMQLIIIYNLVSRTQNYGRLDVVLGDYLANDLKNAVLTEESAIDLMCHFWKTLSRIGSPFDSRLLIGGKGRENEENAGNAVKKVILPAHIGNNIFQEKCKSVFKGH